MKTAISLPDALGHAADLFAAQRDISRSELYAKALAEYLENHRHEALTERINAVMHDLPSGKGATGSKGAGDELGIAAIRNLEW